MKPIKATTLWVTITSYHEILEAVINALEWKLGFQMRIDQSAKKAYSKKYLGINRKYFSHLLWYAANLSFGINSPNC